MALSDSAHVAAEAALQAGTRTESGSEVGPDREAQKCEGISQAGTNSKKIGDIAGMRLKHRTQW